MGDAIIVISLILVLAFIVLGSLANADQRKKCKDLGMVSTQYEGNSYCVNITDLH